MWSFVATALFAVFVILPLRGQRGVIDFVTAYLVEESLSVDNLFVFLMIFNYFRVPEYYTQRVLKWGILTAFVLRGVMIGLGVELVRCFRAAWLFFAVVLIISAVKMLKGDDDEGEASENAIMRFARKVVGATGEYDGDKFFTMVNGERKATPMLVVLVCIELSDVVFAVDSIPAVMGISSDPLVIWTSNVFALIALRSLFALLARFVQELYYLRHAVALILGFVSVKLIAEFFDYGISSYVSLAVIGSLLMLGTLTSLVRLRYQPAPASGGPKDEDVQALLEPQTPV